MNSLIIVTVVLTGPISPAPTPALEEAVQESFSNQAALAAFDGPTSALALGAGDALGYEMFALELTVGRD